MQELKQDNHLNGKAILLETELDKLWVVMDSILIESPLLSQAVQVHKQVQHLEEVEVMLTHGLFLMENIFLKSNTEGEIS